MRVSDEILNMVPYRPGKPISETQREFGLSEVIKLASNENPLGMSPLAKAAVLEALSRGHRYPDATAYELLHKISNVWAVPVEQITVGNGSDELIDLLIRLYCLPKDAILTCEAAFVAYSVRAAASRVRVLKVPLGAGYSMDLDAIAERLRSAVDQEKIRLVFIPNPNNPTGTHLSGQAIRKFLQEFGQDERFLIVFDEAYNEFVRANDYESAQKLRLEYKNVVVLRTLSKAYGLAGLRIGVLIAPSATIELINRIRTPFNVNELAQAGALAALEDHEFIKKSCETTWQGLDFFYHELHRLGLPFVESQGNFVMFDTLRNAAEVDVALLKRGIIMRPIGNYGFKTELRLSVGLPEENQKAIAALEEVLKIVKPIKPGKL